MAQILGEVQITREAVGRIGYLGDLYDARTEQFCSTSILKKRSSDAVRLIDNKETKIDYILSDKFSEKCTKLSINAELKVSILLGCVELGGSGAYLKDEKQSEHIVRYTMAYAINTKHESLNWIEEKLKDAIDVNALNDERATHIVTEIYWGANATATIESDMSEKKDNESINVEGKLKAEISKIASSLNINSAGAQGNHEDNNEARKSDFKFRIHTDVLFEEKIPQTANEVIGFLKNMPKMLHNSNEGKGKPLRYVMVPISVVRTYITNVPSQINNVVKQLDEYIITHLTEIFDIITQNKQRLNDLYNDINSHKDYINEKDVKQIRKYRLQFLLAESKLKTTLQTALVKVRSGKEHCDKLCEILSQLFDEGSIINDISSIINSFDKVQKKISLVNLFHEIGISYIGAVGFSELEKLKSKNLTLYILFFSDDLKNTNYQLWNENYNYFLHMYRISHLDKTIKFVAVDMTFHCNLKDEVTNSITIRCHKNESFTCNDVLTEHRKPMQHSVAKHCGQLETNLIRGINKIKLKLRCPNSYEGTCRQNERTWICWKCKEFLNYDMGENYLHCSCGHGHIKDFVFRCSDEKHGVYYTHFQGYVLANL